MAPVQASAVYTAPSRWPACDQATDPRRCSTEGFRARDAEAAAGRSGTRVGRGGHLRRYLLELDVLLREDPDAESPLLPRQEGGGQQRVGRGGRVVPRLERHVHRHLAHVAEGRGALAPVGRIQLAHPAALLEDDGQPDGEGLVQHAVAVEVDAARVGLSEAEQARRRLGADDQLPLRVVPDGVEVGASAGGGAAPFALDLGALPEGRRQLAHVKRGELATKVAEAHPEDPVVLVGPAEPGLEPRRPRGRAVGPLALPLSAAPRVAQLDKPVLALLHHP
mmetsp:Transcript_29388/g.94820  ORF Transcript_29388/g.94820 Transcript_29388/m.94820 type:complete len:279 (-) Transcript_29388:778-1614(-)